MSVKTIFIGSGDFAIPILDKVSKNDYYNLIGLVSQPDSFGGRGFKKIVYTPVKEYYLKFLQYNSNLTLFQPLFIKNDYKNILDLNPDLIIVASYGQILPENLINYPRFKSVNFHASLLPKLRGAVPIQMSILQNLKKTGVTLQVVDKKMDAGNIICQKEVEISDDDNYITLSNKISKVSADIVDNELIEYLNGDIFPYKQNDSEATYCYVKDLDRKNSQITFDTDIFLADRIVRAFYPDPCAWFLWNGKIIKIYKAKIFNTNSNNNFLLRRYKKSLLLDLKNGTIELLELQMEGKKIMSSDNYLFLVS